MKLIIDTDPGIDDAMAIFYAHAAPEIDLIGLTTVFGNVTSNMATRNALRLVEKMGVDIPVSQGVEKPWHVPFEPSLWVHGSEGFGDIPAQTPQGRKIDETAPEYLVRLAQEHRGELVIAPIGPLTNIAEAIKLDPEFIHNVKDLAIMGGAVFVDGNITKYAEANIYHDPHAADFVLSSGAPITLIGLDVTLQTLCTPEDFTHIAAQSPILGGFLQDMSHFYIQFYRENEGLDGCGLHDPVALIAATHPHLFTLQDLPISVTTEGDAIGQTFVSSNSTQAKIKVCTDVSTQTVVDLFINGVASNF